MRKEASELLGHEKESCVLIANLFSPACPPRVHCSADAGRATIFLYFYSLRKVLSQFHNL